MFAVGDWVEIEDKGTGYITEIDEDEWDGELEFTVKYRNKKGKWVTGSYYADYLSPSKVESDIHELFELAFVLKDWNWCKELQEMGAKLR